MPNPARRPSDLIDALIWGVLPTILLTAIPIGFVSGDGLAQSAAYAHGTWAWNPNHLLYEPLGATWQQWLSAIIPRRAGVDRLKLLSIIAGALTLMIFRYGIAGPLSRERRAVANFATCWVAFGATFLALWVSDETHMVQMPALALLASAVVAYVRAPRLGVAFFAGVAGGFATLFFISNALIVAVVATAFAIWDKDRPRRRQGVLSFVFVGLGGALTAGTILAVAWHATAPPSLAFVHWLTAYGGGHAGARVASSYGAGATLAGLATAVARTGYGVLGALVDVSPVVEQIQEGGGIAAVSFLRVTTLATAALTQLAILVAIVRRNKDWQATATFIIAISWLGAIVLFGLYWNNADDQFYFQLAIAFGAVATQTAVMRPIAARVVCIASALPLAWNAWNATATLIRYPRQEHIALLARETRGAALILIPGMDDIENAFYFTDRRQTARRLALTDLATHDPPATGQQQLRRAVDSVASAGERIVAVGIFDVAPSHKPWKYLSTLGYSQNDIRRIIADLPMGCTYKRGPFTFRWIGRGMRCPTPMADR